MATAGVLASLLTGLWCWPLLQTETGAAHSSAMTRKSPSIATRYWPDGLVPYVISFNFTETERDLLLRQLREVEVDAGKCVTFGKKQADDKDFVLFKKVPFSACATNGVGRIGGQQTVYLGSICLENEINLTITKHNILHILGLPHEHQRFDRDKYITINYDNIIPATRSQFDKINSTSLTWTYEFEYDFASIMHFPSNAFSKKPGELMTIVPKDASKAHFLSPATPRTVSLMDKAKLRKLYCASKIKF